MRRFNLTLLVLFLLVGVPFYWLLLDNRPGDVPPKPIPIAQLRQLAEAIPGAKPQVLEGEVAGYRSLPRDLFAAGSGLKRSTIAVLAWRLRAADGSSVMIDSGITAQDAKAMGITNFDPQAQQRIERALGMASLVLFTHEHPDHQAAALRLPGGIPDAARFNQAQLPSGPLATRLPWPKAPAPSATIAADKPQAVAPGVVVIPAGGSHTPGSQMIYVRMADGRETLFTGDIATLRFSWTELRARSRLVSQYLVPEDRREVFSWLKTIQHWHQEAPGLLIVPGHDIRTLYPLDGIPPRAHQHFGFELQH